LIDSVTGEAVNPSNKARGYEVGEDQFVLVEDRDLERARSSRPPPGAVELVEAPGRESPSTVPAGRQEPDADEAAARMMRKRSWLLSRVRKTRGRIEIERFLPAGQIDALYFEKPYYIVRARKSGKNHSPSFATR